MRLIARKRILGWIKKHPEAETWLTNWMAVVKGADWRSIMDVKQTYPRTDATNDVRSRKTVTIFDVCGNSYRMITAIHYNTQVLHAMRFMTHAEYDKNQWKEQL